MKWAPLSERPPCSYQAVTCPAWLSGRGGWLLRSCLTGHDALLGRSRRWLVVAKSEHQDVAGCLPRGIHWSDGRNAVKASIVEKDCVERIGQRELAERPSLRVEDSVALRPRADLGQSNRGRAVCTENFIRID